MNLAEELDRRRQYFDALEEVFNRKGIEYTIHALPEHVGEFEEYHLINLPSPIMLFPAMVDADSPEVNELPDVIVGALRSHRGDAAPGGYTVVLCGYDWTPIAV